MLFARLKLLGLALGACMLLAIPTGSSAAGGLQSCGGGVRAAVVPCPKAKRIAREYVKTGNRSLQGFICSSGRGHGRCRLDEKLVVFPLD
jgi:hypothetical protein